MSVLSRILFVMCVTFSGNLVIVSCTNDNLLDLAAKKKTDSTTVANSYTGTVTSSGSTTVPVTGSGSVTTATVSFSTQIKPILSKYQCASCHGSSYASYSGASSLAKSGQLYGTMSWASGYRKMPPSQKATATELALIATWIKEGTRNN